MTPDAAVANRWAPRQQDRCWVASAVTALTEEEQRCPPTPLLNIPLPPHWRATLHVKDESAQPTGSLKHRLARSLFLHAICSGWITRGTPLTEASSGSTAISEAHFARLLDLPFTAVMPATTSHLKIDSITALGGTCRLVECPSDVYPEAKAIADKQGGHYLDQFTYAERVSNWTSSANLAGEILEQTKRAGLSTPHWFVVGAGTGGTVATIGRHLRHLGLPSRIAVVDPEGSSYFPSFGGNLELAACAAGSRIEGIGRPRVEPSFLPTLVDRMLLVPDAASLAAMRIASQLLGKRVGASTGTNIWGAIQIAQEARRGGDETCHIVTVLCDGGDRYTDTYYNPRWMLGQGLLEETRSYETALRHALGIKSG